MQHLQLLWFHLQKPHLRPFVIRLNLWRIWPNWSISTVLSLCSRVLCHRGRFFAFGTRNDALAWDLRWRFRSGWESPSFCRSWSSQIHSLTMDTEPEDSVGIPIPSPQSFPSEGYPLVCILELRAKVRQTGTKQLSKMPFESTWQKGRKVPLLDICCSWLSSLGDCFRIRRGDLLFRKLSSKCHIHPYWSSKALHWSSARISRKFSR